MGEAGRGTHSDEFIERASICLREGHLANLFQIAYGVGLRGGGASVAKDADDRLVVAIAGNHLNQECCAHYIIGAGESPKIYRELIQFPSVKGLTAPAGKEIELDAA